MLCVLLYETIDGYVERRRPFRAEHLALAQRWHLEGRLLTAGAFDPPDGALLVFRVERPEDVEAFVQEDPYVREGLVTRFRVREWTVVVGAEVARA